MQQPEPIRGMIFDLDGTLVDSGLDFDLMRREMNLPPGRPLLEALDELEQPRAGECREILARHEWAGAARARLMPGVRAFLDQLTTRRIRQAVFTRNCREVVLLTLNRLGLSFDMIVAREDAPAKPDPTGIWRTCQTWAIPPRQVVMLGDYLFDIEAGRRAGARTVFYAGGRSGRSWQDKVQADFCLHCFSKPDELLRWLDEPA